jgi:hypothetical protein
MIQPAPEISPEEWTIETERVSTKLSARTTSVRAGQGGYATNIANMEKHSRILRNGSSTDPDFSADALQSSLVFLLSGTTDSLAALKRVEEIMNDRWSSLRADIEALLKVSSFICSIFHRIIVNLLSVLM